MENPGEIETNRFEFTKTEGESDTKVCMDLTPFTDRIFRENVFSHFEISVLQGQRIEMRGRVYYEFRLSDEITHAFKTGIVNAVDKLNGRLN